MLKKIGAMLGTVALTVACCGCASSQQQTQEAQQTQPKDTLYQVALLQSLTQGYYDGFVPVSELPKHGDTGIGTFSGVNGEMIVLEGVVYQALGDGTVREADPNETVPFCNVTFFEQDGELELDSVADMDALQAKLNEVVEREGKNNFYMVKIKGRFSHLLVRSETKQEKPYKPLNEALAETQTEFTYDDIQGTVVALYCPNYMSGLNSVGWHMHFLDADHNKGGHVLQVSVAQAKAVYDVTDEFDMRLSENEEFQNMDLSKDVSEAIHEAETATR